VGDFPGSGPVPPVLHTWTQNISAMAQARALATSMAPSALTWTANQAVYHPVWIPWPYPVNRVFWANGTTITTSNGNFGIFTSTGNRVYSTGSTALAGTSVLQFVTPSPTFVLAPGMYYFAYACDATTNRAQGFAMSVLQQQQIGVLQQASNFALADPATFATPTAVTYALCGVTRTGAGNPF
jgi:hypothetical protein